MIDKEQFAENEEEVYVFGRFELNTARGALRCAGEVVPLRPKCYQVLLYLLRHRGKLVCRKELMEAVWPGLIVTSSSLPRCVADIRKALGDDDKSMIRTLPKRGYVFDALTTLRRNTSGFLSGPAPAPANDSLEEPLISLETPSRWSVAAVCLLALSLALTWWEVNPDQREGPSSLSAASYSPMRSSIAVSPFEDMSPEQDQQYPAKGESEGTLQLLAKNQDQTVIASRRDLAGYQHFLQGRFFQHRRAPGDSARAREQFELAVADDPEFADSWVGLAGVMWLQSVEEGIPFHKIGGLYKDALDTALRLDPVHADAHMRMVTYYMETNDPERMQWHWERAIEQGQNSVLVQSMVAGVAMEQSDLQRAIKHQKRAVELDPLSFSNHSNLAEYLYFAGRYAESREQFHFAGDLNPQRRDEILAKIMAIEIIESRFDEAHKVAYLLPQGAARSQGMALVYHYSGRYALRDQAIAQLEFEPGVESAKLLAELYAHMGNDELSFHWLAEALDRISNDAGNRERQWFIYELRQSPFLQVLVNDPRWETLEKLALGEIESNEFSRAG